MKRVTRKSKSKKFKVTPKLVVVSIVVGSLLYVGMRFLPKATPIGINEVSLAPSGTLTLSLPPVIQASLSQSTTADIMIDTGASTVTAIQVELLYDESALSNISVAQGDFLPFKLSAPKIENGKISFAYSINLDETSKSGKGVLATLKFTPIKDGSQISFSKETMAASVDSPANILKSAVGTTIATSKTGEANAPTPPVLTDVAPAPQSQGNPVQKSTTKQADPTVSTTTTTARTFDESGNFDYSKSRTVDPDMELSDPLDDTSTISPFAKFMLFIKNIFKGNNAEE